MDMLKSHTISIQIDTQLWTIRATLIWTNKLSWQAVVRWLSMEVKEATQYIHIIFDKKRPSSSSILQIPSTKRHLQYRVSFVSVFLLVFGVISTSLNAKHKLSLLKFFQPLLWPAHYCEWWKAVTHAWHPSNTALASHDYGSRGINQYRSETMVRTTRRCRHRWKRSCCRIGSCLFQSMVRHVRPPGRAWA